MDKSGVEINLNDISKFIETAHNEHRTTNNTRQRNRQVSKHTTNEKTADTRKRLKQNFKEVSSNGNADDWSSGRELHKWFTDNDRLSENIAESNNGTRPIQVLHTGYTPDQNFVDTLKRKKIPEDRRQFYDENIPENEFIAFLESKIDLDKSKDVHTRDTEDDIRDDYHATPDTAVTEAEPAKPTKSAKSAEPTVQTESTTEPAIQPKPEPTKKQDNKNKKSVEVQKLESTDTEKNQPEEKKSPGKLDIIQISRRPEDKRRFRRKSELRFITITRPTETKNDSITDNTTVDNSNIDATIIDKSITDNTTADNIPTDSIPSVSILEEDLEQDENKVLIDVDESDNVVIDTANKDIVEDVIEVSESLMEEKEPEKLEEAEKSDTVVEAKDRPESTFMAPVVIPRKFKCTKLNKQDVDNLGYFVTITMEHDEGSNNGLTVYMRRYLAYKFDSELELHFNVTDGITDTVDSYKQFYKFVDNLHIVSYNLKAVVQALSSAGIDLFQISDRCFFDVAVIANKLRTFMTCFHKFTVNELCMIYGIEVTSDKSYNEILSEVYMALVRDILFIS